MIALTLLRLLVETGLGSEFLSGPILQLRNCCSRWRLRISIDPGYFVESAYYMISLFD